MARCSSRPSQFVRTLVAARLAADVCGVPTVLVARTDALSATLLTSDIDDRDREFTTGERTPEGFYRVRPGIEAPIARSLAYAPYADVLWFETATPDMDEARRFAEAIHAEYPGKYLAYNCSPSFNWRKHLSDAEIERFQRELGELGYRYQFITLAGFHSLNAADVRARARATQLEGMPAYVELQEREFALEARRLHRNPPPARGRRGILRRGDGGGLERRELDPGAQGLDGGGPVRDGHVGVTTAAEVVAPADAEILTPEALAFVELLQRELGPRRRELLERRAVRQRELDAGARPDFLAETRDVREGDWRVAPPPARPAATAASRSPARSTGR